MKSERGLAVVTGAAGGLGSSFARQLAQRGYRLLLVDRRPQPLADPRQSISAKHSVSTEGLAVDLSQRDELEHFAKRLRCKMPRSMG